MSRYDDDAWWPPPSRPRKAKGGIKARSARGGFGESWWARRWVEVLESFPIGARLQRGRSYARTGQVLSIDVEAGAVTASVQGSRARPYRVSIHVPAHPPADWRSAAAPLASEARYAAAVLAGDLPADIEERLREGGLALFPARPAELVTQCSCPDWSNPCKHVAAVCYLLAEELDRDPFLLFTLRGLDRQGLAEMLAPRAVAGADDEAVSAHRHTDQADAQPTRKPAGGAADVAPPTDAAAGELPADADAFWGAASAAVPLRHSGLAENTAALLHSLGPFPFWQGATPSPAVFEDLYRRAAELGLEVSAGPEV